MNIDYLLFSITFHSLSSLFVEAYIPIIGASVVRYYVWHFCLILDIARLFLGMRSLPGGDVL